VRRNHLQHAVDPGVLLLNPIARPEAAVERQNRGCPVPARDQLAIRMARNGLVARVLDVGLRNVSCAESFPAAWSGPSWSQSKRRCGLA
jgi:hypothetical protein